MNEIKTEPNELTHFYTLVQEAGVVSNTFLAPPCESHLVFLLMRFTTNTTMLHNLIGLDLLACENYVGKKRLEGLQEIGDKCLLICGMFPGIAQRRRVSLSYYVDMGKIAYQQVSVFEQIYTQLCQSFVEMMEVLQAIRRIESSSVLDLSTLNSFQNIPSIENKHPYVFSWNDSSPSVLQNYLKH